jgi:hypothetical protein
MAKKISKWRMRCETECVRVPVVRGCARRANSVEHTIDTNRRQRLKWKSRLSRQQPLSPFDRMLTSEETVLLSLKPGMGSAPCAII